MIWNKSENLSSSNSQAQISQRAREIRNLPFKTSTPSMNVDFCRLAYQSRWETGFGFPRSQARLPNKGTIKAIFIFVDFPDAIGTDSPTRVARKYFREFNNYYKAVSYGKIEFTYTVPNRYFRINKPQSSYRMNLFKSQSNPDVASYFVDALKSADPFVDFGAYDVVYVIPSNTTSEITYGPAFPLDNSSTLLATDEKIFLNGAVAGTDSRKRQNSLEWVWLAHETGHLFGLEHPWKTQSTPQGITTVTSSVAIWDLMDSMGLRAPQSHEFLGWSRFLLEWLDVIHINCQNGLDNSWRQLDFHITPIEKNSMETKLALIRLSETTAIAIESRRNLGFDKIPSDYEGALIYLVDVTKESNEGAATFISSNRKLVNGLSIATLKAGESVRFGGLLFKILRSGKTGDFIRVTRI